MTGPGGYFCTNCPTVIINDAQVAVVAKPRFQYGGVCAIETALGKPDLFETMNGEKSIYILDENKQLAGIASSVHKIEGDDFVFTHFSGRSVFGNRIEEKSSLLNKADAEKRKNKAKAAKKARKANRQ